MPRARPCRFSWLADGARASVRSHQLGDRLDDAARREMTARRAGEERVCATNTIAPPRIYASAEARQAQAATR
jgi:hypothetical protein